MIAKRNVSFCVAVVLSGFTIHAMDLAPEMPPQYKLLLINLKESDATRPTTFAERRQYGYNGNKVPIMKAGAHRGKFYQAGCILANAQPSMWAGFWYADSHSFSNRIFIEDNNIKYEAIIKERASDMLIHSSFLFGNPYAHTMSGTIAILWEDLTLPQKMYISVKRLAELQEQENQLDLDKNKVELGMML